MNERTVGRRNHFERGITAADKYGTNPMTNTGVPLQGFKGEPKDRGLGERPGIPIPGQGQVKPRVVEKPACSATTKKGAPCKAAPITDTDLCVGHTRGSGRDT